MLGNILNFIKNYQRLSVDEELLKKASAPGIIPLGSVIGKPRLLSTAEIVQHYGKPGDPVNLTTIEPPYAMFIAWNPTDQVEKLACHKKIAVPLMNVLKDIKLAYTEVEIKKYGFDQFGGCNNFRAQRNLEKKYEAAIKAKNYKLAQTYLSRHSWAIPVDIDPLRNSLKTRYPKAFLSRPECILFNDIWYSHGFIGYGRERGNDWMHYEAGVFFD